MSVNKLGIILVSGFLSVGTALPARAQSTSPSQDQTIKKQTPAHRSTASKDSIRTAQQALKDKGMYTGAVDGTMNAETQKALRDFQQKNNLQVTGTLNHETMAALGMTQAPAARKSTEATSEGQATGGTTKSAPAGAETTKKTKGTHKQTSSVSKSKICETQAALKKEGFDPGPVDGIMGPMTMTALRNYQSHNGLEVTGTINAETENALMGKAATAPSGTRTKPEPGETPQNQNEPYNQGQPDNSQTQPQSQNEPYNSQEQSTRESLGSQSSVSNGDNVRRVQEALMDLSYNPGAINGMMTPQTEEAIREFQYLNSLPVTGMVDDQTKIALDSQWRGGIESAQTSGAYDSTLHREKPGISSEEQTQTRTQSATSSSSSSTQADQTKSGNVKADKDKNGSGKSDKKASKDASDRISKSVEVLQALTATPDKGIPNELLERAEAVAVIPHVIKGAFGVGGRYGKGVVSQRLESGGWSAPSFIGIGGGSFGAQLGGTATDLVLVFTDRNALSLLEGGKDLKLGADASAVAGPVGRSAEAGVNLNLKSAIYAYSRAKGLFAGVALDGAVLDIDDSMNEKVYGSSVNAKDILNGTVAANSTVRPFINALEKASPKKRISQK